MRTDTEAVSNSEHEAAQAQEASSPLADGATTEPLYNIGAVEQITGLPVATIRAWERRYGFPRPQRTDGGHRIYSERDITRLRWLKTRVDGGMQPSRAVHALEVVEQQGAFPSPPRVESPAPITRNHTFDEFRHRLTAALLAHDVSEGDRILGDVLAVCPMEELILSVLRPTLVDVGTGWAEGQVSVATEHLASNFMRERLMRWMPTGPSVHRVRPVVLACAPDEWHDLSLLMLGVLLRRRRWPVSYLGQAVPLPDLGAFVRDTAPSAVGLVAMRAATAEKVARWPEYLPEVAAAGRPPVCFGGSIFSSEPAWREKVPGIYLGSSLPEGVDHFEAVLQEATGSR